MKGRKRREPVGFADFGFVAWLVVDVDDLLVELSDVAKECGPLPERQPRISDPEPWFRFWRLLSTTDPPANESSVDAGKVASMLLIAGAKLATPEIRMQLRWRIERALDSLRRCERDAYGFRTLLLVANPGGRYHQLLLHGRIHQARVTREQIQSPTETW